MKSKIILLVLVLIFVIHSLHLDFTQDDAFISFRYIKNFLSDYEDRLCAVVGGNIR